MSVLLRVHHVCKHLASRRVVDDVSFACHGGQVTVLSGNNGAGKTTLLSMIAGVMEPDSGVIELGGHSLARTSRDAKKLLGYVPEAANPPGHLTGDELLGLVGALKHASPLPAGIRQALGLDAIAGARIERLSLGERRRVCLAAALIGEPLVLVLDEPTNGLDAGGVGTLLELLRERRTQGAAILIATHDKSFAEEIADTRLRLEDGRVEE